MDASARRGGRATGRTLPFPADDLPPYSGVSPHPRAVRERLVALDALGRGEPVLVVAPAEALATRVLEPALLARSVLPLRPGRTYPRRDLLSRLTHLGYLSAVVVEDEGTFAVRGGIVDLWPTGAPAPLRLDFFDDDLETIRRVDPETQRSGEILEGIRVLPAREWFPEPAAVERLLARTAAAVAGDREAAQLRRRVVETLRARLSFSGVEDWLPALQAVVSPLDHGPGVPVVVVDPETAATHLRDFHEKALRRHGELAPDERPLVPPEERYAPPEETLARLQAGGRILPLPVDDARDVGLLDNRILAVAHGDLGPLVRQLRAWLDEDWRVAMVATGPTDAERLLALLQPHGFDVEEPPHRDLDRLRPGRLAVLRGDLPQGFRAPAEGLAVLPTVEVFTERRREGRLRRHPAFRRSEQVGPGQLRDGDLVVHSFHGIGRFRSMARVALGGVDTDFVQLEYRGGDRLYVPVHKLDLLSRYRPSSEGAEPLLDRLGGQTWQSRRRKVRDAMLRTAHDLLDLYARRTLVERPPAAAPGDLYHRFEATFPYDETPDQAEAIRQVLEDLDGTTPMDRLVVGDVGFGKTEVAMRAAARVVEAGRQVAVLCPTTVLAYQHQETWAARFDGFPVRIAMLSRFTSPAETRRILEGLRSGEVQVVIGTTRLLGRNVRFRDLGLLVVDEEHRFGVKQKEQVKRLRTELDVLSLSATPIPRSLSMALSGVRSFSTIATPPEERLAVRTRIARFAADPIREEILRELERGGQVFFVHNRVRSIGAMARYVSRLVPEARVEVTHGQLGSAELEEALVRFVRKQADVLVTTAIIESGVDLPNVNCIIVNRADRFGLAQLYQIRGRVGRSWRRGRCLLLVPADQAVSRQATRRLRVLLEHQDLGAGFAVAQADLDQRGAGSILGENQHGHVDAVGFETYVELLREVLAEARGELSRRKLDPEVEIPLPAYIPESVLPGVEERLLEYRRLSSAEQPAQLRAMLEGMEERFGELPVEVLNLGWLLETRLRCRALGISHLSWLKVRVELRLAEDSPLAGRRLARLLERFQSRLQAQDDGRLLVRFTPEEGEYPFRFLHWLLKMFAGEE